MLLDMTLSQATRLTFFFQAVALIGFGVLLFARFPTEGSRPLDKQDVPTPAS